MCMLYPWSTSRGRKAFLGSWTPSVWGMLRGTSSWSHHEDLIQGALVPTENLPDHGQGFRLLHCWALMKSTVDCRLEGPPLPEDRGESVSSQRGSYTTVVSCSLFAPPSSRVIFTEVKEDNLLCQSVGGMHFCNIPQEWRPGALP